MSSGADAIKREKNLHATIPQKLLERAKEAARQEHVSIDELVSDAMEQRLNRCEFEEILAFGKRHAQARRLKTGDVAAAIAAVRSETKERNR